MKITLDFTETSKVMMEGLRRTFLDYDISKSYVVRDVKIVGWGGCEVDISEKPKEETNG